MTMNGIKDIYAVAKMTGSKLAPMIVKSEDGESRKFYTLASANLWVYLCQRCTMHAKIADLGSTEELEGIKYFT